MAIPPEILYTKKGTIAYITINRAEKLNSVTLAMQEGINEAFADFNDDPDLRVAIFTGTGDRAFCAGADLGSSVSQRTAEARAGTGKYAKVVENRFFDHVFKPIIVAVNGIATGMGVEMLQGTDIRIAAEHATFGLGEVRWGLIPVAGSHVRLPRQIPWAIAMEIILTGRPITAQQALDWGLVNRVVPAAEVMPTAERFAQIISENSPYAVRMAKELAVRARNLSWTDAFALESLFAARIMVSEDAQEGPQAFIEKRKPNWKGR